MTTPTPEQIKQVAKALAAAYWGGKLSNIDLKGETEVVDSMIYAASEKNWRAWEAAAKIALS